MKSCPNSGSFPLLLLPLTFALSFAVFIRVWEVSVPHIHLDTIFSSCHLHTYSPSLPPPFLLLPPHPSRLHPLQHYHHLRSYSFATAALSYSSVIIAQLLALEDFALPFMAAAISVFMRQQPLPLRTSLASMMISWLS